MDHMCFFISCVCHAFASVHCCPCGHLLGKGRPFWSIFGCGIFGQVWYLVVSIPNLCHLLTLIHHRVSDGDIRQYVSLYTGLLLKGKGREEIYSS